MGGAEGQDEAEAILDASESLARAFNGVLVIEHDFTCLPGHSERTKKKRRNKRTKK